MVRSEETRNLAVATPVTMTWSFDTLFSTPSTLPFLPTPLADLGECFADISSVQFLGRSGRRGDMRDDSAEILFQSFLQEGMSK